MANITNVGAFYTAIDGWSNNLLSYTIITSIFLLVFIITVNNNYKPINALALAFSFTMVINFIFWAGGILPPLLMVLNIVLLAVSLFLAKFTE